MAAHGRSSIERWVRTALALAVAGLLALLGGGVMLAVGGPATAGPDQAAGSPSAVEDECVPADAWTETTDWLTESPGDGWYVVDEKTVVDQEATHEETGWVIAPPDDRAWVPVDERTVDGELVTEAVDQWWHWNPGDAGGVQDPTGPPPLPGWNQDNGNHNGIPAPPNEPYNTSNDRSGNSSWFFHEVKDATYEQVTEYLFTLDTPAVTHVEYVFGFDHPAVTCEEPTEEPTDETEPPEVLPTEATEPVPPSGPDEPANPEEPAEVEVLGAEATAPSAARVPTAVDAGVGGPAEGLTAVQMAGTVLMVGGTTLLLAAGGVLVGARTREAA
jgi:hypothetical protein